jgi:hypothetical protein
MIISQRSGARTADRLCLLFCHHVHVFPYFHGTNAVTCLGLSAGNKGELVWPKLDESTPPVHVKIFAGALPSPDVGALGSLVPPVGKKSVADYTVQVNDKYRRPMRSGYFPLRAAEGDRLEDVDINGACFALTGDLQLNCPSYMHILPPVAGESVQRLWVTTFGMARAGSVVGIDLTGKLPARRLKAELVWPNAVEHVPAEFLDALYGEGFDITASILIADGFLVPGKTDGGVFLVQNPGSKNEIASRLTRRDDKRWFYHRAIPFEMQVCSTSFGTSRFHVSCLMSHVSCVARRVAPLDFMSCLMSHV